MIISSRIICNIGFHCSGREGKGKEGGEGEGRREVCVKFASVRMQSVIPHSAWAGRKTFALARCTDSGDKRRPPRSRRTKEERKTMVESFIKK